jgi:hypothetical protein
VIASLQLAHQDEARCVNPGTVSTDIKRAASPQAWPVALGRR